VRHPLASAGPTWRQVNPLNVTKCVAVRPFSPVGRQLAASFAARRYSIHAPILRVAISQLFFIPTRLTPRSWLFGPSRFNSPSYVRVEQKKRVEMRAAFRSKAWEKIAILSSVVLLGDSLRAFDNGARHCVSSPTSFNHFPLGLN
jgi:hypothetical protein